MTIDKKYFQDYDWEEAFRVAGLSLNDVSEFYGKSTGQYDGDNWLCYGRLNSGEYFFLSSWCDYTSWGWDCKSGGSYKTDASLDNLIVMKMGDEDRARLGLP